MSLMKLYIHLMNMHILKYQQMKSLLFSEKFSICRICRQFIFNSTVLRTIFTFVWCVKISCRSFFFGRVIFFCRCFVFSKAFLSHSLFVISCSIRPISNAYILDGASVIKNILVETYIENETTDLI